MDKMDEQRLKERLAKFAGFERKGTGYVWPDGRFDKAPDFPNDPDACFRWLAPPIEGKGLTLDFVSFKQASGRYYVEWKIYEEKDQVKCGELLAKDWQAGWDLEKITALAFCLATNELIEGSKDDG